MRNRTDAKYPFLSMSLIDSDVLKARERIREKWEEREVKDRDRESEKRKRSTKIV